MRTPAIVIAALVLATGAGVAAAATALRHPAPGAARSSGPSTADRGALGQGNAYTGGVRYEVRGSLGEPSRTASAYRLRRGDGSDVRRIAAAFGISGEVSDVGGQVVLSDGTRRVTLSGSRWAVDLGVSGQKQGGGSATAVPGGGTPPAPPRAGAPIDAAAAERAARTVLVAAGLDVSGAPASVADERPGWTVRLRPVLGGRQTVGLEQTVTSRGDPRLLTGQGWLGGARAVAELKLIGVAAGLRQVRAGLLVGDLPAGSAPNATPVTRTVVAVRLVLAAIHTGKADLLPAYRFDLDGGGSVTTPAVDAAALAGR